MHLLGGGGGRTRSEKKKEGETSRGGKFLGEGITSRGSQGDSCSTGGDRRAWDRVGDNNMEGLNRRAIRGGTFGNRVTVPRDKVRGVVRARYARRQIIQLRGQGESIRSQDGVEGGRSP